ncbi:MAG: choice-of-anchor J domain-containing protein [Anaerolineae bacterium]
MAEEKANFMRYLAFCLLIGLSLTFGAPAAAQAPRPAACAELLVNGGLEDGAAGWQISSADGYPLLSQALPHTGQWGAFLAGYNEADDRLAQAVALPAGQTSTLRFWWQARTDETDHSWDTLDVEITPAGAAPIRLQRITDADAGGGWQQATFDLSAYAAQTVTLSFHAQTDFDRPTDFYLDDISLEACAAATSFQLYLPLTLR